MAPTPTRLIAAVTLIVVAIGATAPATRTAAATIPTVKWKTSSLPPKSIVRTSSILTTQSKGTKTWSVKGDCSYARSRITTKSRGTCRVTVKIAAKSPYSARVIHKRFPIKPSPPASETFDPYAGTAPAVTPTGTKSEGTLVTADGRTRRYRTYVPPNLGTGVTVPLVIALHGGLGTSSQFEGNSGLNGFADSNRFIVAYPDGIGNQPDGTGFQTWNGGYCCGPAAAQSVDDVGFIRNLVARLSSSLPIDRNRIYAMGHSNGGILSYRLACEISDLIVAIGVQAGSNIVSGCAPMSAVSVAHLHGTADANMPIDGGKGAGLAATVFVSARAAVEAMAGVNGCPVVAPRSLATINPDATALSWTNCRSSSSVMFITVKGATHAWMGHAAQSPGSSSYVGDPYPNLDATRVLLSFLLSKSR